MLTRVSAEEILLLSGTDQDELLYMLVTQASILKLTEERQYRILDAY